MKTEKEILTETRRLNNIQETGMNVTTRIQINVLEWVISDDPKDVSIEDYIQRQEAKYFYMEVPDES